jgi:hypothetical protein
MRRWVLFAIVVLTLLGVTGCFSYDPGHNALHWGMIRRDLQIMHEDVDFMTGFDATSHASRTEY